MSKSKTFATDQGGSTQIEHQTLQLVKSRLHRAENIIMATAVVRPSNCSVVRKSAQRYLDAIKSEGTTS